MRWNAWGAIAADILEHMSLASAAEERSLGSEDEENYWRHWMWRLNHCEYKSRRLFESSMLLLCHVTGTPAKKRRKPLELIEILPPPASAPLGDILLREQVKWLHRWHDAGRWEVGHPHELGECPDFFIREAGSKVEATPRWLTRVTGEDYDVAVVAYMSLVAALATGVADFALREHLWIFSSVPLW